METPQTPKQYRVKVVVPLYRTALDQPERKSLTHNLEVLGNRYPVVFIMPEGVDAPAEAAGYPVMRVSDEWLGRKNGLAGYNRMMMSREFYDLFSDCDYILICQTDVWLFRDELEEWCNRGYDYVAAPFPRRPIYDNPVVRCWLKLRKMLCGGNGRIMRQDTFGRIINGGFSLRKVDSHREACVRYADIIERFNRCEHHLYNEDLFWGIIPREFRYPTVDEALEFSFDVKPDYCYRLTGGRLPFGCHGWFKPKPYMFWRDIIK